MQDFLRCEEINPDQIRETNDGSDLAISCENANFSWGGPKKTKEEKEEEEKEKAKPKKKEAPSDEQEEGLLSDDSSSSTASRSRLDSDSSSESVKKIKDEVNLKSIGINIKKGEFVCIMGEVGSGKSSLINALLGDMIYVSPDTLKEMGDSDMTKEALEKMRAQSQAKGVLKMSGSVSLVQQTPWIQNATIRDNILFGEELEEEKYNRVLDRCQLGADLDILEGGDLTEIGEKGINLSGGQKARVSLARAVYQASDIVLMDDPISALDANVKKKVFHQVFNGELAGKTRILVTHAVDFIEHVDRIIILENGMIKSNGSFDELKETEELQHIIKTLDKTKVGQKDQDSDSSQEVYTTKTTKNYISEKGKKLLKDEEEEEVTVDWQVYMKYLSSGYVWLVFLIIITPSIIFNKYTEIEMTAITATWTENAGEEGSMREYIMSYT